MLYREEICPTHSVLPLERWDVTSPHSQGCKTSVWKFDYLVVVEIESTSRQFEMCSSSSHWGGHMVRVNLTKYFEPEIVFKF